ncbi:MAG: DUF1330 domain-containing protein [Pseudomonadota bacterium]
MKVVNQLSPTPEQLQALIGNPPEGRVVMVNLLKFHERAQYEDGDRGMSGGEAFSKYAEGLFALIEKLGGKALYSGKVAGIVIGEVEDNWDRIAFMELPSIAAFQRMLMSPEYQEIASHRSAGLKGQLLIPTTI